jgi:hypothetical protein
MHQCDAHLNPTSPSRVPLLYPPHLSHTLTHTYTWTWTSTSKSNRDGRCHALGRSIGRTFQSATKAACPGALHTPKHNRTKRAMREAGRSRARRHADMGRVLSALGANTFTHRACMHEKQQR